MPIKPILRRISPLVDKNTASKLHLHAQQSSVQRRLTQEQLAIIYQEKWFKMFVPIQFNGLELSLIEGLKLQEQLAYIDGSLGWTVTLCSGACMFFGYLSLDVSHDLFKDEKVCFAGSGQATGVAVRTKKGYKISGDWKYATGADLATIFTVNCQIVENGQYLRNQDGSLQIASFFLLRKDVQIEDDWQAFGLEATGSFGFKAKNGSNGQN